MYGQQLAIAKNIPAYKSHHSDIFGKYRQPQDKSKKGGGIDQMATAVTSLANSVSAALHGNVVTPNRHPGSMALMLHRYPRKEN